jgi:acetyl-CoA acetyltransferase
MAAGADFHYQYTVDDFFHNPLSRMSKDLFAAAEMTQDDIDVAQLYDNFTPTILFTLEGMGFCGKGEAGHWVTPERISRGGQLPINTSGGHTSESYMQGWALLAEAVRQVRGECGDRQVSGCETALYTCAAQIANALIFRR